MPQTSHRQTRPHPARRTNARDPIPILGARWTRWRRRRFAAHRPECAGNRRPSGPATFHPFGRSPCCCLKKPIQMQRGLSRTTPRCRFRWRQPNAPMSKTRIRKGNQLLPEPGHFRATSILRYELRTPGILAIAHGEQLLPTSFRRWTAATTAQAYRWRNGNSCPPSPSKNPCFSKGPAGSRKLLQYLLFLGFGPPIVLPRARPTNPRPPMDYQRQLHPDPRRRRARSTMPDPRSTNRLRLKRPADVRLAHCANWHPFA